MSLALLVAINLPSIVFAVGGVFLAYCGKEGWGWCFFLSALCLHTVKSIKGGAK